MVRIQHFRRIDKAGKVLSFGGLTIAYSYEWNRYGNKKADSSVVVATSVCSDLDQFCRSIGSSRALANFKAGHVVTLPVPGRDLKNTLDLLGLMVSDGYRPEPPVSADF